jgi:hypothetical protein
MTLFRLCSRIMPFAITMSCGNPIDVEPLTLFGTWVAIENASPSGSHRRSLSLGSNGSFTSEVRSFGIYPDQSPGALSSYQRTEGTFGIEVEGNGLIFHPIRLVSWDLFYGVESPERIAEPYPHGSVFDDATYEIRGRELILDFTIYPADAPVPARLVFTRLSDAQP